MQHSQSEILHRRVSALDSTPLPQGFDTDPRLLHATLVMAECTNSTTPDGGATRLTAQAADEVIATSRLLDSLRAAYPDVVAGPLDPSNQLWVATGPHADRAPDPARFVPPSRAASLESTKPFGMGVFTSTGVEGSATMWSAYLELLSGPTLHPLPWQLWRVDCTEHARPVAEITTAGDWVRFLEELPAPSQGTVYPDWVAAAAAYDAVHMTLQAVAATQGCSFETAHGPSAPTYWDVESTLWLNWSFSSWTSVRQLRP